MWRDSQLHNLFSSDILWQTVLETDFITALLFYPVQIKDIVGKESNMIR